MVGATFTEELFATHPDVDHKNWIVIDPGEVAVGNAARYGFADLGKATTKRDLIQNYLTAYQRAMRSSAVTRSSLNLRNWLDTAGFFMPKEVREPFWNHLVEDRDAMRASGRRECLINLALISQIAWIVIRGAGDLLLQLLDRRRPRHQ